MASKYTGIGSQLQRGNGAIPEVFSTVPSAKTITGPKHDRNMIDSTTLDAPSGFETYLPGLKKPGVLQYELVWDPADATHRAVLTDWDNSTLRNWKIVYPDLAHETFSFTAYVKSFEPKASTNADLTMSMELQLSGPVARS